jgi:hypothetical protein
MQLARLYASATVADLNVTVSTASLQFVALCTMIAPACDGRPRGRASSASGHCVAGQVLCGPGYHDQVEKHLHLYTTETLEQLRGRIQAQRRRRRQNKRFQCAQAVTNRARAVYPHAKITVVTQDTKGSNKQITFNKGASFHDVLLKKRKAI